GCLIPGGCHAPRKAGHPVPAASRPITTVSGILDRPPQCAVAHKAVDDHGTMGTTMEGLMKGKRGLIMGIANDHSIAWGMARTLHAHGAELAFTFQGDAQRKRVKPLAQSLGVELVL